jgi:hypothetical protein
MPPLTHEAAQRKARNLQRHHARQARMPKDSRPRRSPREIAPPNKTGRRSMRCCMEHPEKYPNDFRYLYATTDEDYPLYFWLNYSGIRVSEKFSNLPDAFRAMLQEGWEDASW